NIMFLLWRPLLDKQFSGVPRTVKEQLTISDFKITSLFHIYAQVLIAVLVFPITHFLNGFLIYRHSHNTKFIGRRVCSLQCLKSHFSSFCSRSNLWCYGWCIPREVI